MKVAMVNEKRADIYCSPTFIAKCTRRRL